MPVTIVQQVQLTHTKLSVRLEITVLVVYMSQHNVPKELITQIKYKTSVNLVLRVTIVQI